MYGLLPPAHIRKRVKEFIKTELDGICPPLEYYKVKSDDEIEYISKGDELLFLENNEKKLAFLRLTTRSKSFAIANYTCIFKRGRTFEKNFQKVCFFRRTGASSLTVDSSGAYIDSENKLEEILQLFKENMKNIIVPFHNSTQTMRDLYEFEKLRYYKWFIEPTRLKSIASVLLHQKICQPEKAELMYPVLQKIIAQLKIKLPEDEFNEKLYYMQPVMEDFNSFKNNQELIDREWLTEEDLIPSLSPDGYEKLYRMITHLVPEQRDKQIQSFVDMYGFRL